MGVEATPVTEKLTTGYESVVKLEVSKHASEVIALPIENLEIRQEASVTFEDEDSEEKEETIKDIVDTREDEKLAADCEKKGHDHTWLNRFGWRIAGTVLFVAGAILTFSPMFGGFIFAGAGYVLMITGNFCMFKKTLSKLTSFAFRKARALFKRLFGAGARSDEKTA